MSPLRDAVEDYLRMRRVLGYKLEGPGRQLEQFVSYLEQTGAQTVTIENAVAWATRPVEADPGIGARGCRWCASSPVTCRQSTRPARCRPRGFCPTGPNGRSRTRTHQRRSPR